MKSIFEYVDYRILLKDYYEQRKNSRAGYSVRQFARDAGMNSSAWLFHLIRGTKNLSSESALKVAKALKLKSPETEFFQALVHFTQAQSSGEKNVYYRTMLDLKRKLGIVKICEEQYEYYSSWYHPVIRSLVSKVDFCDDYSILAAAVVPSITPGQAKQSVKLLSRLGLIVKNENGEWTQADPLISTGDEVNSLNIVNYHKQVSRLAEDVFDRVSNDKRDISALTLGIGEEEFRIIRDKIRAFRKEILQIAHGSTSADRVYQLNLQFFPVSQTGVSRDGGRYE